MIRHPLLPPIIRPDLIPPPHPRNPNDTNPQPRLLFLPSFAPRGRDLGAQDPPGFLPVLVLRPHVLDADGGAGRGVGEADGGIGGVDVLAAGAAGAHDVCSDIGRVDVEVRGWVIGARDGGGSVVVVVVVLVWESREDEDGGGARVSASLGFGGGDALYAVDAGFAFEKVVGAWGVDFEDDFVDAVGGGFGGGFGVEFYGGETQGVPFAVGLVHAEEVTDEEAGFGAAGAGADFEEAWEVGEGVGGDKAGLEGVEVLGEC